MSKTESPDAMFKATVLLKGPKKFRRAGVGFVQGEQVITVNQTRLDAIKADPMLKVLEVADAPATRQTKADKANN